MSSLKVLTHVELSDNKRTIAPEELCSADISQPDDFYNFCFCLCPSERFLSSTLLKVYEGLVVCETNYRRFIVWRRHTVSVFFSKIIMYAFTSSVSFQLCPVVIHHFSNPSSWKKIKLSWTWGCNIKQCNFLFYYRITINYILIKKVYIILMCK